MGATEIPENPWNFRPTQVFSHMPGRGDLSGSPNPPEVDSTLNPNRVNWIRSHQRTRKMPLPSLNPEPEAIRRFLATGHPRMAFAVAMSWQWKATFTTCFLAALGLFRFLG